MLRILAYSLTLAVLCPGPSNIAQGLSCDIRAQNCYTDQKDVLNKTMLTFNFQDVCKLYPPIFNCMDNVALDDACQSNDDQMDIEEMHVWAVDEGGAICTEDGQLTGCGADTQKCLQDLTNALADLEKAQVSSACPLLPQYDQCSSSIEDNQECGSTLNDLLDHAAQYSTKFNLLADCEGPCSTKIAQCTTNVTSYTRQKIGDAQYCQDAIKLKNCANNLKSDSDCGDIEQIGKIVESQDLLIADICVDGSVSPCAASIVDCLDSLRQVMENTDADTSTQCKATTNFDKCVSKLPCADTLSTALSRMKGDVVTQEFTNSCPKSTGGGSGASSHVSPSLWLCGALLLAAIKFIF